jgi:hypothetical protein
MTPQTEPVRWLDDPSELPADVIAELQAYPSKEPSLAQLAQVRAGLLEQGVAPGAGPLSSTQRGGPGMSLQLKVLVLVWLGTTVFVPWKSFDEPAPRTPAHEAVPIVVAAPPAAAVEAESLPAVVPTPSRVEPPARPKRLTARAKRSEPVVAARPEAAAELPMLQGARRALAAAPARTLELTAEHARLFPHGVFEQERELLIIEALLRTGERAEAHERVVRFQQRFPQSVHLERVRVLSASM